MQLGGHLTNLGLYFGMTSIADVIQRAVAALDEDDLSEVRRTVFELHQSPPLLDEDERNEGVRAVILQILLAHPVI